MFIIYLMRFSYPVGCDPFTERRSYREKSCGTMAAVPAPNIYYLFISTVLLCLLSAVAVIQSPANYPATNTNPRYHLPLCLEFRPLKLVTAQHETRLTRRHGSGLQNAPARREIVQ
ncbi:Uncharacterized protein HZ326_4804 [Fusarium oxysporum f. sp. albedinis]|nr:Uncharacterized protein HZ326_4804 [Fusarium oxysporum f. sp. albedinis]